MTRAPTLLARSVPKKGIATLFAALLFVPTTASASWSDAPQGLSATALGLPGEVSVGWTRSAEEATGYRLFRATTPTGPFAEVADVGAGEDVVHTFATSAEGFTTHWPPYGASVSWESANERVEFYDLSTSIARFERQLSNPLTPESDFHVQARWATTVPGGDRSAFPLLLTRPDAQDGGPAAHKLGIEFQSPAKYVFHYYDASGVERVGDSWDGSANTIYLLSIRFEPQDGNITFQIADASGFLLHETKHRVGEDATDYFSVQKLAMMTGGRAYIGTGDMRAWIDDVSVSSNRLTLGYIDQGLANGREYHYRVGAIQGTLLGTPSESVPVTTIITPPGPPKDPMVASGAPLELNFTWTVPEQDGGASISSYRVYRQIGNGPWSQIATVASASYRDLDVQGGMTYGYRATAVNSVGEGPLSAIAPGTVPSTLAPAPSEVTVAQSLDAGKLVARWNAPPGDPHYFVTGYNVYRASEASGPFHLVGSLSPGGLVQYNFDHHGEGFVPGPHVYGAFASWEPADQRIRIYDLSTNVARTGRMLPAHLNSETNFSVKAQWATTVEGGSRGPFPLILSADPDASGSGGMNTLSIQFRSPSTYQLRYFDSTGAARIDSSWAGDVNRAYNLRASYDRSTRTVLLSVEDTTGTTLHGASYVVGSIPGDTFDVSHISVLAGGLPYHGDGDLRGWVDAIEITTDGERLSFRDPENFGKGSLRHYRISALTNAGEGALSAAAEGTTIVTAPTAPVSVQAEPGTDPGDVVISWSPPTDTGGSPLTTYRIFRGIDSGSLEYLAEIGHSPFVDTSASPLQIYFYAVAAVSSVGEGPRSTMVEAMGASPPPAMPTPEASPFVLIAIGGFALIGASRRRLMK